MILQLTSLTYVSTSVVTVKMVLVGYALVKLMDVVVARSTAYVLSDVRNCNFKFRR